MALATQRALSAARILGTGSSTARARLLARGTAVVACTALAAGAVLGTAAAAPMPAQPETSFSPASDLPTAADIAAAKKSESATATEAATIAALLDRANGRLQQAMAGTSRASDAYTNALVTLQDRQTAATAAVARATAADTLQGKARNEVGQLAGDMYKNAGMTPSVQSMLTGAADSNSLYSASTLVALGQSRNRTLSNAQSVAATAEALRQQAQAATKAADDAAATAESAKSDAESAYAEQQRAVTESTAQRTVLIGQLATLHSTTVALETQRVTGLEKQKEAAQVAAVIAESARQSAADPAAQGQQTANQPTGSTPVVAVPVAAAPVPVAAAPVPVAAAPAPPVSAPVQQPSPQPAPVQQPAPRPVPVAPAPPAPSVPVPEPVPGSGTSGMVNFAMSKVGGPYVWGGTGPVGFDCSGLVYKAFASIGVSVPRTGSAQYNSAPIHVPLSQARPGDLVMFNQIGAGAWTHIAIYIGNGMVVQALSPGMGISVNSLASMWVPPYGTVARY